MMAPPADPALEEALVPLSALQHYLFCPRQAALIHVERLWTEDGATAEGRILHERVDGGRADRRAGVRTLRGIALRSLAQGLFGKADAVEFRAGSPVPYPVEYKRGSPKAHRADEVQLCAQALCLEEMFGKTVPEGALFYNRTKKRLVVVFDDTLRALTMATAQGFRTMVQNRETPRPRLIPGCKRCSLVDQCWPGPLSKPLVVQDWLAGQVAD